MQPAAQVQAVIELLEESIETKRPADRLMANYFRQRRYIGSKDKAAISELFYACLRGRLSLEYLLLQADVEIDAQTLVAAQLFTQGQDLNSIFTGERHFPEHLADTEKFASISADALAQAPMHVQLNVPAWLADEMQDSLAENYEAEMRASLERAKTQVRCNTLKTSKKALHDLFSHSYDLEEGVLSPWSLGFNQRVALFNYPEFKQGHFEVQDEGSQILALITQAKAGERVVDFCAGAGGKTLAMAAMMQNKGVIHACDVHSKRLQELQKRTRRAGVHNVQTHVLSSERDKWVKQQIGKADLVLIDAPCSGTGTWRRSPDSRWNLTFEQLDNLEALQSAILESASRLVKPGGRLVYATCSLLKRENEQQISSFVAKNSEFERSSFDLPDGLTASNEGSELRLFSSTHQTDGFFAASLKRKQD